MPEPATPASSLSDSKLEELLALTRRIGWEAGDILLQYENSSFSIDNSGDGPVTTADLAANQHILQELHRHVGTQDFAYLTEETFKSQPTAERQSKSLVWIIDPLDGTKDFIQKTGEYAVHIALVEAGRPVLAVVAWPAAQKLYYARLGGGTYVEAKSDTGLHQQPMQVSERTQPETFTLIVSRTHRDERFNQLIQRLPYQNKRYVGSVGCKIATILEQKAEVYISLSGKSAVKDWDLAAPELILSEAGGRLTHFDGSPLLYNQTDVSQWGALLASHGCCHTLLCQQAIQALAAVDAASSP